MKIIIAMLIATGIFAIAGILAMLPALLGVTGALIALLIVFVAIAYVAFNTLR